MSEPRTDVAAAVPRRPRWRWPRFLPPARVLWIALAVLGLYGTLYLRGLGETTLAGLPLIAGVVDLGFQRVRFPHLRIPDAALATGLFLALIFPPGAGLVLAGLATFAAVALRHALRFRGHPWVNPASLGVTTGVVLLGLAPAWWVAVGPLGTYLMLALGGLLLVRNYRSWRLPAAFLVAYSLFLIAEHLLAGTSLSPQVLLLAVLDPATLFFGLFMVTEPRTAPAGAIGQSVYGIGVAFLAALLPLALPSLGIVVALLLGNLVVLGYRMATADYRARPAAAPRARSRKKDRSAPPVVRWPIGYRAGAMALVLVVFLAVVAAAPPPAAPPLLHGGGGSAGSGGSGPTLTSCARDNPSIPSATLSSLHAALGPSVILSYDANTGVTVFYDPVNHVTVTETDLYEDFGYAEFNGDDLAVNGCHP